MILDKKQVLRDLSFVENKIDCDLYLCSCGHEFEVENTNKELKAEIEIANKEVSDMITSDHSLIEEFGDLYKNLNISLHDKVECPSCKKSFLTEENRRRLISKGIYFVSGFKFEEDKSEIKLYYAKIKFEYNSDSGFNFVELHKYIKVNKANNTLFYSDYNGKEIEFDLDEIVGVINNFLVTETQTVYNAFELHSFIHALSNLVLDRKSIDIVSEMLESVRNRVNDLGIDAIKKVVIVFLSIIRYSNLSTIAMTKGPNFLYDILVECKLPKPKILTEQNITSPIKIFNFLAQNYITDLNKEILSEDKERQEFSFKSKQFIEFQNVLDENGELVKDERGDLVTTAIVRENQENKTLNINFSNNKNYKTGKVKDTANGYGIVETVEDGTISKFIFKNITKFSDYKYIIKYLKLITKQQLIVLLQRYDLDFLTHAIDLVYFRDKVTDFNEFQRILNIMIDFCEHKNKLPAKINQISEKTKYAALEHFDFIPYDDSLMMMTVLKFDKKRHFDKIKTWKELNEYHDNLIKYFKTVKEEEKNGSIEKFVSQFNFLTDRSNYNGPIEIVLLSTPVSIIKEGVEMQHSGAAYAKNVASGTYLMAQVYDRDENRPSDEMKRYTIGFKYDKYKGLIFDQIKGFANKLGSDRFKRNVMEWLEIKDVSYQPIKDLKLDSE